MGQSNIEWTDLVWNPTTGCTHVSSGCANCYAEAMTKRLQSQKRSAAGRKYAAGFDKVVCHDDELARPLTFPAGKRVFVNSMSDLFHDDVPDDFIDKVFAVMARCSRNRFQILTKRAERMRHYHHGPGRAGKWIGQCGLSGCGFPLTNVWLGVSCEDQRALDERVPCLLETPAVVRFVSLEPLLGPIDLRARPSGDLCIRCGEGPDAPHDHPDGYRTRGLDWVIVGGESGPKRTRREMKIEWVESIVEQCDRAGVAVFVKQDSSNWPGQQRRLSDALWARKEFPRGND